MDEKLKIKLSIADRVYPLTIDPKQEEGLRKASKSIYLLAKKFEQNYAVEINKMCSRCVRYSLPLKLSKAV